MNPLLLDYVSNKKVLEIGGPSIILQFLYNSTKSISLLNHKESIEYFTMGNMPNNFDNIFYGDIVDIKTIIDNDLFEKFEVVISSHILEHVANPILSLKNLKKCLIPGGIIITSVPDKNQCWDRVRKYTEMNHIINDYESNILENDMTHIHESACMNRPNYYNDIGDHNNPRIIHHHTFNEETLLGSHEYAKFETIKCYTDDIDPLHIVYIGTNIGE
jgi:SAM-dependent methyltransferase